MVFFVFVFGSRITVFILLTQYKNFFINKDGKSVNSSGVELTAANWKSLKEFAAIVNGGIDAIPRDASGKIALGDFLQFVAPASADDPKTSDISDNKDESEASNISAPQAGDTMKAAPFALAMIISAAFVILEFTTKKKYVK